MSKDTHIAWCNSTWNPWIGCTKVSPGCLHCYAETRDKRFAGGKHWGKGAPRQRTSADNWKEPARWNRAAMEAINDYEAHKGLHGGNAHYDEPRRPRVFCASLSDWLDNEVPIEWLLDLLVQIFDCGFLDWQMLTKRPENWKPRLALALNIFTGSQPATERNFHIAKWLEAWLNGTPPYNVWIGVSVEDQTRADERIPLLLEIPAKIRFLSCEPLLGRVELSDVTKRSDCASVLGKPALAGIDWVIVGGESGNDARVTNLGAVESLIHQCKAAKVACFVKQLGARPDHDFVGYPGSNIDRRLHLKHPKGGDLDEWPDRFRVREFPEVTS